MGVDRFDHTSRVVDFSWNPDGKLNLNFNGDGGVDRHLDASSDHLLGEWRDNAKVGLDLAVDNWDNLAKDLAFLWCDNNGSLDRVDDWHGGGSQDWEASFGDKNEGGIKDLVGTNMVELNLMSSLKLGSKLLNDVQNNLGIQVEGRFNASHGAVDETEWARDLPSLELQFFGDLVQLLPDGRGSLFLSGEEVQVLLQKEVHAVGVGRELNSWDLVSVGWSIVDSLERELVGDQGLLSINQLVLVVDKKPQVLNKGRVVDVLRVLDAILFTLDQVQNRPGLQANSLELLNLSVGQGPEGGDNEGRNLLRWLHPGADS